MVPILFMSAFAALVGAMIWTAHRSTQQRTAELQAVAERLGWGFREKVPYDAVPRLDRFELFDRGRNRTLRNLLTSPAGEHRAVVFDYSFVTGGGKSQQTHQQTVFYATSEGLALPPFSLRPENFFHRIGQLVGFEDIDFEDRPAFSSLYLLRGADDAAVRGAFNERVTDFLERRPGMCAAALDGELLYWRAGRRVKPEEVEALIQDGFELAERFTEPADPDL